MRGKRCSSPVRLRTRGHSTPIRAPVSPSTSPTITTHRLCDTPHMDYSLEVSFVDEPSSLAVPRRRCPLRYAITLIDEACNLYGFDLNCKRGKAEAIVHLAGDGARDAAKLMFLSSGRRLPLARWASSVPTRPRDPCFLQRQPLSRSLSALCGALKHCVFLPCGQDQRAKLRLPPWPCGPFFFNTAPTWPRHAPCPRRRLTPRTCLPCGCAESVGRRKKHGQPQPSGLQTLESLGSITLRGFPVAGGNPLHCVCLRVSD